MSKCCYAERSTFFSVHRERQEREEAEREGRTIQEEEASDENIQSPFQPIGTVISKVHNHSACTTQWFITVQCCTGYELELKLQYISKSSRMIFFFSGSFQNDNKEKERKRQGELQEGKTNSLTAGVEREEEEEEYEEDNGEEPDDTRQTPENTSSGNLFEMIT